MKFHEEGDSTFALIHNCDRFFFYSEVSCFTLSKCSGVESDRFATLV